MLQLRVRQSIKFLFPMANGVDLQSSPSQPPLRWQAEQRPQMIEPAGAEPVERNRLLAWDGPGNVGGNFRRCGTQSLIHPRRLLFQGIKYHGRSDREMEPPLRKRYHNPKPRRSEVESRGRKKAVPTRCTTSPMASASRTALFPRFLCRNEAAGMTGVLASRSTSGPGSRL